MEASRIVSLVAADPALQALRQQGKFGSIASAINAMGLTRVVSTASGEGTILETLGPVAGGELLDQMEALAATNSAVKWALKILGRAELNLGATTTRAMLDALLPPAAAAALKAVAEVPDTTNHIEVMTALGA